MSDVIELSDSEEFTTDARIKIEETSGEEFTNDIDLQLLVSCDEETLEFKMRTDFDKMFTPIVTYDEAISGIIEEINVHVYHDTHHY